MSTYAKGADGKPRRVVCVHKPLDNELALAQRVAWRIAGVSEDLAHAGQAWLAPGQQAIALGREERVREHVKAIRILLDQIELGLVQG